MCECHATATWLNELCEYYCIPHLTKQTRNLIMIKFTPSLPPTVYILCGGYHCKNEKEVTLVLPFVFMCQIKTAPCFLMIVLYVGFLHLQSVSVPLIEMQPFSVLSFPCLVRLTQCCHLAFSSLQFKCNKNLLVSFSLYV